MNSADILNELPNPPSRLSGMAVRIWEDLGSSLVEQGRLSKKNLDLFSDLCFWEGRLSEVKLELQNSTSKPIAQTARTGEEPAQASILLSNIRAIQDEINKRRKQLGLEVQKREDISNTPVIPEDVFHHLPERIQNCTDSISDDRDRDSFLFMALPVLTAHLHNVRIEQAERTIQVNLFSLLASNQKEPGRSVKRAADLASVTDQYYFNKVEKGYTGLMLSLDSDDYSFQEVLAERGGRGLIFEAGLDDAITSEMIETGLYNYITEKALRGKAVSLMSGGQKRIVKDLSLSGALYGTFEQAARFAEAIGKERLAGYLFYIFDKKSGWQSLRPSESARKLNRAVETASEKLFDLHLALHRRSEALQVEFSDEQWQMIDDTFSEKMEIIEELGLPHLLQAVNQQHAVNSLKLAALFAVLNGFEDGAEKLVKADRLMPSDSDMMAALWLTDTSIKHAIRLYQYLPEATTRRVQGERLDRFFETLPANFSYSEAIEFASRLDIPERTATRYLSSYRKKKMIKRIKKGVYRKL